jgi:hypothetical protein
VAPTFPDLTPCDFYLSATLKDKVYKKIPTLWENQDTTSAARFQQFPGKNSRELTTTCSAGTLSAFGQEGNIFSICCSTGEFLLGFLKVVLTTIAYRPAPFTDRYPSCDAALGARAAERAAAASPSSRKKSSL